MSPPTEPAKSCNSGTSPRAGGGVPTPPALARRLLRRLAGRWRQGGLLDPCCGAGALLLAGLGERPPGGLWGLEIDRRLAARARARLGPGVRQADALEGAWPAGTWVVANPPWVSFAGRRAAPGRGRPGGPGGWPSLHSAFLVRIAEHVANERTGAALLLPSSVLEGERYGALREAVTRLVEIRRPVEDLGEGAFPGVTEPCSIVELAPTAGGRPASPAPWTPPSAEAAQLQRALGAFPRLPPQSFADPGVHTGNSARELVLSPAESAWPGLRQGRDLAPFALGPPSARLRTDRAPGAGRRFRIPPLERLAAFPVLLRQTADRPLAALHREPTYFRNSLLACRAVEGLDPAFVTGVLNGSVSAAWHRALFRDARQRAFPQVKVGHLATQPFPIARRRDDPRLHDRIVAAHGDPARIDELCAAAFGLDDELRALVTGISRRRTGRRPGACAAPPRWPR